MFVCCCFLLFVVLFVFCFIGGVGVVCGFFGGFFFSFFWGGGGGFGDMFCCGCRHVTQNITRHITVILIAFIPQTHTHDLLRVAIIIYLKNILSISETWWLYIWQYKLNLRTNQMHVSSSNILFGRYIDPCVVNRSIAAFCTCSVDCSVNNVINYTVIVAVIFISRLKTYDGG